jgi:hypothetical protein
MYINRKNFNPKAFNDTFFLADLPCGDSAKSTWISKKIRKLKAEGKSQKQAVAQASSMWKKRKK